MKMLILKPVATFAACLTLAMWLASTAAAQECPEGDGVPRVFGAFVLPDNSPDWEDPASIVLIAHSETGASDRFRFQYNDPEDEYALEMPDWLAGSTWLVGDGDATHVTAGGPAEGLYAWLETTVPETTVTLGLPPNGARATTGPGGDVVVLARYWVKLETNPTICGLDCGYKVIGVDDGESPPAPGATGLFYIGCGLFSK